MVALYVQHVALYIVSNQKQPNCKKGCGIQKASVKKDVKLKVAVKKYTCLHRDPNQELARGGAQTG